METYFRKYYQSLCYFAQSIVNDDNACEDIVQDVFVKIISAGNKFESELHFRQYAYIAVKNACVTYLMRKDKMTVVTTNEHERLAAAEFSDYAIIKAEIVRMIKEAVDSLSPRYRDVFIMAYIRKMKNEEIAQELGISVNTVKVIRQRAKMKMRELLKDVFPLLFIYLKYIDLQ